jgi:hypothetical protein
MKALIIFSVSTLALVACLLSCGTSGDSILGGSATDRDNDGPGRLPGITPEEIEGSDRAYKEAGLMALWYCDELIASAEIYLRFDSALKLLRNTYADSIPEVNIPFQFPAVVSEILVGLTDSAALELQNGTYHEWDSLNTMFRLEEMEISMIYDIVRWVKLTFKGQLHPDYLAPYYEQLDGVESASRNGYIGDWPNIYPWILDGRVTFLVRDAWGDCPAGCICSHLFYFKETDSGMECLGDWLNCDPLPPWYEEAKAAMCMYLRGDPDC